MTYCVALKASKQFAVLRYRDACLHPCEVNARCPDPTLGTLIQEAQSEARHQSFKTLSRTLLWEGRFGHYCTLCNSNSKMLLFLSLPSCQWDELQ